MINDKLFDYSGKRLITLEDLYLKYQDKADHIKQMSMLYGPQTKLDEDPGMLLDEIKFLRNMDLKLCTYAQDIKEDRAIFLGDLLEEYHTKAYLEDDVIHIETKFMFKNEFKDDLDFYFKQLSISVEAAIKYLENKLERPLFGMIHGKFVMFIIRRISKTRSSLNKVPDADNIGNEKTVNAIVNAIGLTDNYKVMWYCSGAVEVDSFSKEGTDFYVVPIDKAPDFLDKYI